MVARRESFDRHLFEFAAALAHGRTRHPAEQGAHLATGPAFGKALEQLSAGIHQRDDIGGERFAEDQRGPHRQRRHQIEPDIAFEERGDDFHPEGDEHRHRGDGEDPAGSGGCARGEGREAGDEPGKGQRGEPDPDRATGQPGGFDGFRRWRVGRHDCLPLMPWDGQ